MQCFFCEREQHNGYVEMEESLLVVDPDPTKVSFCLIGCFGCEGKTNCYISRDQLLLLLALDVYMTVHTLDPQVQNCVRDLLIRNIGRYGIV